MENRITNRKENSNSMISDMNNFGFNKGMTREITTFTQEKRWYFCIYKMNISSELLREFDESEYGEDYVYTADDDDSGQCSFDENLTLVRMNDDWYVSIRSNGDPTPEEIEGFLEDAYWCIYSQHMGLDHNWEEKNPTLVFFNADIG